MNQNIFFFLIDNSDFAIKYQMNQNQLTVLIQLAYDFDIRPIIQKAENRAVNALAF